MPTQQQLWRKIDANSVYGENGAERVAVMTRDSDESRSNLAECPFNLSRRRRGRIDCGLQRVYKIIAVSLFLLVGNDVALTWKVKPEDPEASEVMSDILFNRAA